METLNPSLCLRAVDSRSPPALALKPSPTSCPTTPNRHFGSSFPSSLLQLVPELSSGLVTGTGRMSPQSLTSAASLILTSETASDPSRSQIFPQNENMGPQVKLDSHRRFQRRHCSRIDPDPFIPVGQTRDSNSFHDCELREDDNNLFRGY